MYNKVDKGRNRDFNKTLLLGAYYWLRAVFLKIFSCLGSID